MENNVYNGKIVVKIEIAANCRHGNILDHVEEALLKKGFHSVKLNSITPTQPQVLQLANANIGEIFEISDRDIDDCYTDNGTLFISSFWKEGVMRTHNAAKLTLKDGSQIGVYKDEKEGVVAFFCGDKKHIGAFKQFMETVVHDGLMNNFANRKVSEWDATTWLNGFTPWYEL